MSDEREVSESERDFAELCAGVMMAVRLLTGRGGVGCCLSSRWRLGFRTRIRPSPFW